jgi:hypothetical protein
MTSAYFSDAPAGASEKYADVIPLDEVLAYLRGLNTDPS